ncbi:MAG: hypothetical protein H6620_06040 [Halobacteriovoraceae bacterium]|nr:hypothetical protein [Halobacteriovoraceae bacterium]
MEIFRPETYLVNESHLLKTSKYKLSVNVVLSFLKQNYPQLKTEVLGAQTGIHDKLFLPTEIQQIKELTSHRLIDEGIEKLKPFNRKIFQLSTQERYIYFVISKFFTPQNCIILDRPSQVLGPRNLQWLFRLLNYRKEINSQKSIILIDRLELLWREKIPSYSVLSLSKQSLDTKKNIPAKDALLSS